jgi:putative ABC transport system permease protein
MTPTTTENRQASFQQTLLSARRTMMLSEILKLALDSFRASKLRFALTALGMVIGTASVILVVTIGLTGKQFILNEIQKIGTNEVEVEYAGGGSTSSGRVLYNDPLTRDDEKAVLTQVPSVIASSPVLETHDSISFGGGVVKDTLVLGVSPQYKDVRNLMVLAGRFMDDQDENHLPSRCPAAPMQPLARRSRSSAFRSRSLARSRRVWTRSARLKSPTKPSSSPIPWPACLTVLTT